MLGPHFWEAPLRARSTDLADIARLVAIAGGSIVQAAYLAQSTRASDAVCAVLKAAADAGTTTDSDWARPLVEHDGVVGAFIEALRGRSVFARLLADGAVRLPLKTRTAVVTALASAWITGEGLPVPVSGMALAGSALQERKAAALVVVTNELLRSTAPAGRALVDASLKAAVSDALDSSFLDIVGDGIAPLPASGPTAADALSELRGMLNATNQTGNGSLFWIAAVDVGNAASALTTASGDLAFPGASPVGGEMLGLPMLVSSALVSGTLMLVDASGLAAELETITVSLADQASIQMDTAPTNPPVAATVLESLWQSGKVALLARAFYGAEVIREGAVALLSGIEWGAV